MNFTVAPRKVSYKFAWEIDCPDLDPLSGPPVALHSAWLFMNRKIIYGLIETNLLDTDDRLLRLPTTVAEINSLFNKADYFTFFFERWKRTFYFHAKFCWKTYKDKITKSD